MKLKSSETKRSLFLSFCVLSLPTVLQARPLFLEPAATEGRHAFEVVTSLSVRTDKYGSPQSTYQSESFPITFRFGLQRHFDIGFTIQHVAQHVESNNIRFSGSDSGRFSPEFKWALRDNISLQGIWHVGDNEESGGQGLPIAQGNSPEIRLLGTIPIAWPICVDVGYLHQGRYNGRLGVENTPKKDIDPGDIADARLALLIPLPANFSVSLESVYSHIGTKKIDNVKLNDSAGDAWDAYAGLSWSYKNVTLGAGVGGGLLDESHTSFAIDRGAGDLTGKFLFSYKLEPPRTTN